MAVGDEARIGFRHSVYGSRVEECFRVLAGGLRLAGVRYEEYRLVEFYGRERGQRDGDWWAVGGDDRLHRSLALRVSPESDMRLSVGREAGGAARTVVRLSDCAEPGGRVVMTVVRCADGSR